MIFDTWGGSLTGAAYREFSLPYMESIVSGLKRKHAGAIVPSIVFTKGGGAWLEDIAAIGADGGRVLPATVNPVVLEAEGESGPAGDLRVSAQATLFALEAAGEGSNVVLAGRDREEEQGSAKAGYLGHGGFLSGVRCTSGAFSMNGSAATRPLFKKVREHGKMES